MPDGVVIFNPAAGRGRSGQQIQAALSRVGGAAWRLAPTTAPGHAEELAFEAASRGVPIVVAAGGDGTVHEVANGVLNAPGTPSRLMTWPLGSSNDYAHSLGLSRWWRSRGPIDVGILTPMTVDVGRAEFGGRSRWFVNGLGSGFNAAVTEEARKIRFLRGLPLYSLALLRAMSRRYYHSPMRIRFEGPRVEREVPTLSITLNIAHREGGFPLAARADLTDGLFEIIHAGPLKRRDLAGLFPAMVGGSRPRYEAAGAVRRAMLGGDDLVRPAAVGARRRRTVIPGGRSSSRGPGRNPCATAERVGVHEKLGTEFIHGFRR